MLQRKLSMYLLNTELRNTRMLNPEIEPTFEVYHAEYEKYTKALDNLIDIAKKELKFK